MSSTLLVPLITVMFIRPSSWSSSYVPLLMSGPYRAQLPIFKLLYKLFGVTDVIGIGIGVVYLNFDGMGVIIICFIRLFLMAENESFWNFIWLFNNCYRACLTFFCFSACLASGELRAYLCKLLFGLRLSLRVGELVSQPPNLDPNPVLVIGIPSFLSY